MVTLNSKSFSTAIRMAVEEYTISELYIDNNITSKEEVLERINNGDDFILDITLNDYSDWDNIAKATDEGEYYTCRIKCFGNETIEKVFFNYITEDWEDRSFGKDIQELTDDEIAEYYKDLEIEENASIHPLYLEYREYCSIWQSNFNATFAFNNGNRGLTQKMHGNEPDSFSKWLKQH